MALALMTILLYHYNCQLIEKQTSIPQTSICSEQDTASGYCCGITNKETEHTPWSTHKNDTKHISLIYSFDEVTPQ